MPSSEKTLPEVEANIFAILFFSEEKYVLALFGWTVRTKVRE